MSQSSTDTAPKPKFELGFAAWVVGLMPPWLHPNHVTVARIVGSVLMLALGLLPMHLGWSVAVGVVTGFSDNLDGAMARRRGQVTELGALLDPMADKLLGLALFILSWYRDLVDWRLLVLLACLDLHAVALPLLIMRERRQRGLPLRPLPKVRPSKWGKIKTAWMNYSFALIFIGGAAGLNGMLSLGNQLLWGAVALGLVSGTLYFVAWRKGDYA